MRARRNTIFVVRWQFAMLAAILLGGAREAHAYLDPTTGSMILQGIVGGIMAGLFLVRHRWAQLKGWFSRRRAGGTESSQASPGGDAD